jgi:hypothetical protein
MLINRSEVDYSPPFAPFFGFAGYVLAIKKRSNGSNMKMCRSANPELCWSSYRNR